MVPRYFALDCLPGEDGVVRVLDVQGGVGGGLAALAEAYGGKGGARQRLQPYLRALGEVAGGRLILFVNDPFSARLPFPDDFFDLVQQYASHGPITDWVPDLQGHQRARALDQQRTPDVEQMGLFLEPLASRLGLRIAYCSSVLVDHAGGQPRLLVSGYRERARRRATTRILQADEVGVIVYSGDSARFPADLDGWTACPVINPPLLDRLLESRFLVAVLLRGSPAERHLPRWTPVGMGLRTGQEVLRFADTLLSTEGFPAAVLLPSHITLGPGVRFLDRTALRALAARQPRHRLALSIARNLLGPRISHSYEETARYPGKLLDILMRTPGAEVCDHGDGTFHFSAPYPFLDCTVSVLREFVEPRPVRSRRTGRLHRGSLRVAMFERRVVAAIYRLDQEPDDGRFRDISRPDVRTFYEGAPPEAEARLQQQLGPFVTELEERFDARIRSRDDLAALKREWLEEALQG